MSNQEQFSQAAGERNNSGNHSKVIHIEKLVPKILQYPDPAFYQVTPHISNWPDINDFRWPSALYQALISRISGDI